MALNAVKFLGWHRKLGPEQNILGPVKVQGISLFTCSLVSPAWFFNTFTNPIGLFAFWDKKVYPSDKTKQQVKGARTKVTLTIIPSIT